MKLQIGALRLAWLTTALVCAVGCEPDESRARPDEGDTETEAQHVGAAGSHAPPSQAGSAAAPDAGTGGTPQQQPRGGSAGSARAGAGGTPAPQPRAGSAGSTIAPTQAGAGGVTVQPSAAGQPALGPTPSNTIEVVAFDENSNNGDPRPVLLYRGGYASYNIKLAVEPVDVADDVYEHPTDWYEWRRESDSYEIKIRQSWKTLIYKYDTRALPKGTTLAGTYENYAIFLADATAASDSVARYRFTAAGTFESCEVQRLIIPSTGTIRYENEPHSGRYTIDGFTLRLDYTDGGGITLPFFFAPDRPKRLWVSHRFFELPNPDAAAICVRPN